MRTRSFCLIPFSLCGRQDNKRMREELMELRHNFSRDLESSHRELQRSYHEPEQHSYRRKSPMAREIELSYQQGILPERSSIERRSPRKIASPRGNENDEYSTRSPRGSPPKTEFQEIKLRDPGSPRNIVQKDDKVA